MESLVKYLHWLPRVLCILAICFVSMFAFDVFSDRYSLIQQITALAIHLIPSFVLIIFLVIAWKWELIGGILFIVFGIALSPFIYLHNYKVNHFSVSASLSVVLIINLPFIIVGFLFVLTHLLKKKELHKKYL